MRVGADLEVYATAVSYKCKNVYETDDPFSDVLWPRFTFNICKQINWRLDIWHNDTQHNDTQHNKAQRIYALHTGTQHNGTQHYESYSE
jgi:hypothetical protein